MTTTHDLSALRYAPRWDFATPRRLHQAGNLKAATLTQLASCEQDGAYGYRTGSAISRTSNGVAVMVHWGFRWHGNHGRYLHQYWFCPSQQVAENLLAACEAGDCLAAAEIIEAATIDD